MPGTGDPEIATPDRQAKQQELVRAAEKLPGVAEALDVYARATEGRPQVSAMPPRVRHATGGNAG